MELILPLVTLPLVRVLDKSGWMMWPVLALSRGSNSVDMVVLATTTVPIQKMLESDVKVGH